MTPLIEYAKAYARIGFKPIQIIANNKTPQRSGWQNSPPGEKEAAARFQQFNGNIGLALPDDYFVLDVDIKGNGPASLQALEDRHGNLPHTLIQKTPSGGRHYVFHKAPGVVLKNTASKLGAGLDIRASGGQIVAEPSTIDGKAYAWNDWDVLTDPLPVIADAPAWLLQLLQSDQRPDTPAPAIGGSIAEGGRNAHLFSIATAMRSKGDCEAAILAQLRHDNAARCMPPLPDAELISIARSAGKYAPAEVEERATGRKFELRTAASMLDTPKPHDWLIKGYFEADCLIQLIGEPEAGKSLLALEWAASIATGEAWRGNDVQQGPVIYLLGEGGNGFARRMKAWESQNVPIGEDVPLLISKRAAGLPSEVEAVAEAVESFTFIYGEPALIVVDTLARSIEGDENSQKDMGAFITGCDILRERYHCAMLIVHHSGHGETKRGRGSSTLPGAVDMSYLLTKDGGKRQFKCLKAKDIEPPEPLFFRVEGIPLPDEWKEFDGGIMTAPVLVGDDGKSAPSDKRMTDAQRLGMRAFQDALDEGHGETAPDGTITGLHLEAWREKFYELSTADNVSAKKVAFQRIRKDLVTRGDLEVKDDIYSTRGKAMVSIGI